MPSQHNATKKPGHLARLKVAVLWYHSCVDCGTGVWATMHLRPLMVQVCCQIKKPSSHHEVIKSCVNQSTGSHASNSLCSSA